MFEISDSTVLPPSPLTASPGHLSFSYVQGASTPPSEAVTVAGGSFTATATASWITVAPGSTSLSVSVSPASLAPGAYQASITLAPPSGSPASVNVTLNILAAAPVLTSVSPELIAVGSNDTTITIHGTGFTQTSMVQLEGLPWTITPVAFVDSSTLQFSLPENFFTMPENFTIAVQNPQSALSNLLSLAVGQPAPQFTARFSGQRGELCGRWRFAGRNRDGVRF